MLQLHKIWINQCEAARGIEDEFGTQKALAYLVGEKLLNYIEAAEHDPDFKGELPVFVAEINKIFEPWQLEEYLDTAHQSEAFDPTLYDEDEAEEMEEARQDDIRHSARDLFLLEQARWWLLGKG